MDSSREWERNKGFLLSAVDVSYLQLGHSFQHLTTLILDYNDFSEDPVGAMKCLVHVSALRYLSLNECHLTTMAVTAVSDDSWPHITYLNLNELNQDGRRMQCEAAIMTAMQRLLQLSTLEYLDLSGVRYEALGKALCQLEPEHHWPHLTHLVLDCNDFRDDPGATQRLLHLSKLTHVSLVECELNKDARNLVKTQFGTRLVMDDYEFSSSEEED
jgi:hypothetical protein